MGPISYPSLCVVGVGPSSSSSSSPPTVYVSINNARRSARRICEMNIQEIMNMDAAGPSASIVQWMTSKPFSPDAVTNRVSIARINDRNDSRPASSSISNTHALP